MVWDVDLIVVFHQTTQKEKVLSLLLAINREDNVHSTTSLQVQHASRAPAGDRDAERTILVWFWHGFFFFFFFFNFQPKATRAGDEKHRKKSTWPYIKTVQLGTERGRKRLVNRRESPNFDSMATDRDCKADCGSDETPWTRRTSQSQEEGVSSHVQVTALTQSSWSFFISTSSVLDCQWSWPACVAWNVVSDLTVMDVGSITDPHHVSCGFSNENKSESREENGEALEMSLREHGSSAEESTVPVEQSLSHQEAFAHFRKGLKQLLDDQLLKYLPEDVSLKEVEMQLALHQGRAITVFIQRLDGQTVPVPVLQGARVKDLKAAIQLHIAKQVKRSGGPTHISWRSVWRSYWLSCNKVRFTDENALLSDYGVGNRDTVVFLKRLREHGIRSWLA